MTAPTATTAAPISGAAAPPATAAAWGVVHRADLDAAGRVVGHVGRATRHGSPGHAERHYSIETVALLRSEDAADGRDPSAWLLAWWADGRWHTTDHIPGDTR
ncbi:hypothetical protein [Streptomyces sp. SID3343]|uniref:hypothetical protein n=1 Tax=Streptomyces sp. SID3343 TaxID=2690260 RepID=UPI00136DFAB5|nr:hypothetical protein [Streptomyces sp. SID3343]MYW03492.1 hypothetical protein [Streptomyces sp. SID3343]